MDKTVKDMETIFKKLSIITKIKASQYIQNGYKKQNIFLIYPEIFHIKRF